MKIALLAIALIVASTTAALAGPALCGSRATITAAIAADRHRNVPAAIRDERRCPALRGWLRHVGARLGHSRGGEIVIFPPTSQLPASVSLIECLEPRAV
jgi:hypothetical protein